MSSSEVLQRVSVELIEFSDSFAPPTEYIKTGKELVEAVYAKLNKEHTSGALSKFKAPHFIFYGGSVGKKTSVIYPDFDCVVSFTNVNPPLTPFLEEFKNILETHAQELSIIPESIKLKRLCVNARFKHGVEMDLLAACSFDSDPNEQQKLVLEHIRKTPTDCLLYSSSLAGLQRNFLTTQSGFTHQLIRLAKYWYKSLSLGENLYGGSAMMEILCAAVIAENEIYVPTMLDAFSQFLNKVYEMDTLKIAFVQIEVYRNGKKRKRKKWKLIKEQNMVHYENYFDLNIISRSNYIIEPANPFNDMAQNISKEIFAKLKKFANSMKERLTQLESSDMLTVNGGILTSIDISKLFEPIPLRLSDDYSKDKLPTEALVDSECTEYNSNSAESQLIQNNSSFDEDKSMIAKTFLNNLTFLIRAPRKKEVGDKTYICYTDGVPHVRLDEVKRAVKRLTSVNFELDFIRESSSDSEHSGYDVTIHAPYHIEMRFYGRVYKKYAVQLSLKWS